MIEGESIILAASALAYAGYMSLSHVIFLSFLGSMISDQICFLIGYRWGDVVSNRLIRKFPKLDIAKNRALILLKKHEIPFIFGFRFIYGIRNISPFIIGIAKTSILKFFILNGLAALIWAVTSCLLGYFLGNFIMSLSGCYRFILLGSIGFVFSAIMAWKILKGYKNLMK